MGEPIKSILKPIRRKAQESTGIDKIIYDNMLREIDCKFTGKETTRQEIICEIERQRSENHAYIEEDKRWLKWLTKEAHFFHW